MKILVVFGTRPEAIKLAPLILELKKHPSLNVSICITGQHNRMLTPVMTLFGLKPDYNLRIMKKDQDLVDISCRTMYGLRKVVAEFHPDRLIVQGDTTSAFATAMMGFYEKIPVLHVEAGLRSCKLHSPWPEEMNRKIISLIADINCAPTRLAARRLREEGVPREEIFVTGNTIVDALQAVQSKLTQPCYSKKIAKKFSFLNEEKKLVLVTGHRRESFGLPLKRICLALKKISEGQDVEVLYSVHANPNVRRVVRKILGDAENVHLIEPVNYLAFVYLMQRAYLILTDSGGIQEEALVLGKPVLVLREETERLEGIATGGAKLIGRDVRRVVCETREKLTDQKSYSEMLQAKNPYGEGNSAELITEIILEKGGQK